MKPQHQKDQRSRWSIHGFTLTEMMVTLVAFAIIGAAIYTVMIRANSSKTIGSSIAEAQESARAGLELILRDLRQAGYGIDENTQVPIETASEYRCTFLIDRDQDGTIEPGERITFFLDNNANDPIVANTPNPVDFVVRRVISTASDSLAAPVNGSGQVVAYGVTQRTPEHNGWNVRLFDYFDEDGASLIGAGDDPDATHLGKTVPDSLLGLPAGGGNDNAVRVVRVDLVTEAAHRHPETHSFPQVRVSGTIHPRNLALASFAMLGSPMGTGTGTGTGTSTGTGTGTGTATGTSTGTGTGTGTGMPPEQPPIHIPTERVLSLILVDLHEQDSREGSYVQTDHQHDWDIVVGTQMSGSNHLPVWFEGLPDLYQGERFYQSYPHYWGYSYRGINRMVSANLDGSSTDYPDVVAAVSTGDITGGFEVWLNQGPLHEGWLGTGDDNVTFANGFYSGNSGRGQAIDVADFNRDGRPDVVLGTRTGSLHGAIELWLNLGSGVFTQRRVKSAGGEVNTVVAADLNGDGYPDVAAGTKTQTNDRTGQIEIWINRDGDDFERRSLYDSRGKVNALAAGRMNADDSIDLVAGTKTGMNSGEVELWLNNGEGSVTRADYARADGVVMCLALGRLDYGNESLDIAIGNGARSVQAWFCNPEADSPSEIIPANESWADANAGGAVNDIAIRRIETSRDHPEYDFLNDIVVGTAISATSGEIVLYLNPYVWTLQ